MKLKRIICFLMVLVMLPAVVCFAYNGDVIVYVTNTGEKYHNDGCGYLRSRNAMTLEEAVESGYTPCSRCDPPIPDFTNATATSTPKPTREPVRVVLPGGNSRGNDSVSITTDRDKVKSDRLLVLSVVAAFVVLFVVIPYIRAVSRRKRTARLLEEERLNLIAEQQKQRLIEEQKRLLEEKRIRDEQKFNEEKQHYESVYGGKSTLELAGAPEHTTIGNDGLPKSDTGDEPWGSYTYYVTGCGRAFHSKSGCSGAFIPINAYTLESEKKHAPCSRCRPVLPDTSWVKDYRTIEKIKKKYGID